MTELDLKIQELKNAFDNLKEENKRFKFSNSMLEKELQEYRRLEEQGLLLKLPCKVGDTVYKISRNKVKECEVVFIGISADEKCSYFNFVENYSDGTFYKSYTMVFDVIGKTVFLTKEEAEKALEEMEK